MARKEIDLSFMKPVYDTFELPSRGVLYDKTNPLSKGFLSVRPWVTAEEKLIDKLQSYNFYHIMKKLIENTIEEPVNIDEMTIGDFFFTLYWIRQISYGSVYSIRTSCPECRTDVKVNIDVALCEKTYIPEDVIEPFNLTLPITNIELKLRLPRIKDLIEATENSQYKEKQFGVKINETTFKKVKCIQSMILPNEARDELTSEDDFAYMLNVIWPKLPAADSAAIDAIMNKYDHGYIGTVPCHCPNCDKIIEQAPILSAEFFRPSSEESE